MRYTFGTSQAAAARLETIASFFNPVGEQFIREFVPGSIGSALDLGCGPGFSTQMLVDALPNTLVYGLDTSKAFLQIARDRCEDLTFFEHDVTQAPFPIHPDLIYARFLLSHLPNPVDLTNKWTGELAPRGLLFLEELEAIDTEVPVFKRYLEVNTRLIENNGADLFVGRRLAQETYSGQVLCNRSATLPVHNARAAAWFYPNTVTIWRTQKHVRDQVSEQQRLRISEELARIRGSGDETSSITWHMRQLAIQKTSPLPSSLALL